MPTIDQDVLPGNTVSQMLPKPLSHCEVMTREAERYPVFATPVLRSRVVVVVHVDDRLPILRKPDHPGGADAQGRH
jgi:hypothetical protein